MQYTFNLFDIHKFLVISPVKNIFIANTEVICDRLKRNIGAIFIFS